MTDGERPAGEPTAPVVHVHARVFRAPPERVGTLLDSLAGPDDRLWPYDCWPALRLDRGLRVGSRGGHGPIRYAVEAYEPGRSVRFRFSAPAGLDGWHAFEAARRAGGTELRHTIAMRVHGTARLSWPLVFRPLHDALLENALDRAAEALGEPARRAAWSWWVRVLRRAFRGRRSPRVATSGL